MPSFRKYLAARWLGSVSVQMISVAVGVQVYSATGRTQDLAMVGLVQFVPMLLCVLPAGRAADTWDGRSIAVWCDVAFALCAAVLVACAELGRGAITWVYLALALLGVGRSFYGPAVSSLLPRIVGPERLSRGVAMQAGAWQTAAIGGPALTGLLLVGSTPRRVYVVALVGLIVALVLMAWLRLDRSVEPVRRELDGGGRGRGALEGLRFVFGHDLLLSVLALDFLAVFLGGATALIPVIVKDELRMGADVVGWLRAAPAIGAAFVSLWLSRNPIRAKAGQKLLVSVAVFGAGTIVFGLSKSVWLSALALLVIGGADTISVVVRGTLVQHATPPSMRGRVSAVNQLFVSASNELGEFESGMLATYFGAVRAVVIGGVGTVVVVAGTAARFRVLRELERVEDSAPHQG